MAKHYYKVLFDYDGTTGERMIAVKAGEVLYSDEDQSNTDWFKVTRMSNGESGLVPASYVNEITIEEADILSKTRAPIVPNVQSMSTTSPSMDLDTTGKSQNFGVNELASPGKMSSGPNAQASGTGNSMSVNMISGPQNSNISASNTEGLPDSFAEMFQRHDAYFRQVVKQREESFKKLEAALAAACKDIAACKEKNAKLTQRITELDALIEEERRKWRERLEIEKKNLLQNTQ